MGQAPVELATVTPELVLGELHLFGSELGHRGEWYSRSYRVDVPRKCIDPSDASFESALGRDVLRVDLHNVARSKSNSMSAEGDLASDSIDWETDGLGRCRAVGS